jgi:hypothetical protein
MKPRAGAASEMRAGWLVSLIGHIGLALMTTLAWQTSAEMLPSGGSVVPVEIVDIAAESNVRALAEDVPDEDVAPDAQEETREAQPAPAPAPGPAPRQPPRNRNDSFDLAAAADLFNADTKTGRRREEGQRADRTQRGAGLGTAEVAALEDRLRAIARAHIARNACWRMPIDLPEPERLVVTVRFQVNRNGTLNGEPEIISPRNTTYDPAMRTAVESARRAIRLCDPFPFPDDPTVAEHYEIWREMEYTFRPRL